jgi:hypothetical protein
MRTSDIRRRLLTRLIASAAAAVIGIGSQRSL